jgi:nickel transport protein
MNMRQRTIAVLLPAFCILLAAPPLVLAHGAHVTYRVATTVDLEAQYDNGEPMGGAQVAIYAPDDPTTVWLTGICDEEGRFSFTPDPSLPGTWDVQVRQAGHGDMVHIIIGEGGNADAGGAHTPLQIVVMAACVIWGLVGTALYFSRRKA